MVGAGVPPEAVLRAATVAGTEAHGFGGDQGQVRPGYRADLLLLTADPRLDIRNVARRAGVMAAGRWLSESALQELVGRSRGP